MIDNVLHAAFVMTTPILLAALGGLINRIGGLVNIGLDAMMLVGRPAWADGLLGDRKLGAGARRRAVIGGAVVGLFMSLVVTRLEANEIVVGLGFNVAVAGLVRFFLKATYGTAGTLSLPNVVMLPRLDIPVIAGIPVIGAILSRHDPLTWACLDHGAGDRLGSWRAPAGACACAQPVPRRKPRARSGWTR